MRKPVSRFTVMYTILFIIVLIIICGTIAVFASRKARPGIDLRKADPSPQSLEKTYKAYTDIGQIRTSTAESAAERAATVLVEPWFSYKPDDTTFYEEFAGKKRKIRSLITEYFASQTASQLRLKGENSVKAELQTAVNRELVLGSIYAVYFEEYIIIE